ncbi:MAG: DUF499 domain-containing protein, partial [Solirubrobacteraceae bacterium]
FITQGMRTLLDEAFKRLEGVSGSASPTFLLGQSMGGGKTHNLLALALLAKHPEFRGPVMGAFHKPGPLGRVEVVAIDGRRNYDLGIWGAVAEQLNRRETFNHLYSPLRAPGVDDWVNLLRGAPLLLLFDELPPYFQAARAYPVGNTTLDTITTTALANLLVAVNEERLPNVCVVLTDLGGTAYGQGAAAVSEALDNLKKETGRGVTSIDPVRLNTNELYAILRTRLFEALPSDDEIGEVAEAYRAALHRAQQMDLTAASPDQLKAEISASYPFHPAIRDLYARFKENPGFQQTRALIRIMRITVARLWETRAAAGQYLVGAQDFDLHQQEMVSEVRQINGSLDAAIAHDIAGERHGATAEQIDGGASSEERGDRRHDAEDVARLIFLSSLSQAVNPTLGLSRSEIAMSLAAPDRDLKGLRAAIDRLQEEAWYLHVSRDLKLLFRNTENLVAKLQDYTRGKLREQREDELRTRLREMFKIEKGGCYQKLEALPHLDEVELDPERVTLVIQRPGGTALAEMRRYYDYQQFKNRVLFLSGNQQAYETVLQRAAELSAIGTIIGEWKREGRADNDPQLLEAEEIRTKKASAFYQACRETFQTLYYPSARALTELAVEPRFEGNDYRGEAQIVAALKDAYKYREDTGPDSTFSTTLVNKLWPEDAKEVAWSEIRKRAATDPAWGWHHPGALDSLKTQLVQRDVWREHGGFVERGPFPKPPAAVDVRMTGRADDGTATLQVRPLHGDTVYFSEDGEARPGDGGRVDLGRPFVTKALRVSFLAADSAGEHETGEPLTWKNTIEVKHRFYQDGGRRCELRAVPTGALRYTLDGKRPDESSAGYAAPFVLPEGCRFVLALAESDGVRSEVVTIDVPQGTGTDGGAEVVTLDPHKPAIWKRKQKRDDNNATYSFLTEAQKHGALLGGVALTVAKDSLWVEVQTSAELLQPAADVTALVDSLKALVPSGNANMVVDVLRFESGRDLEGMVRDLKTELKPGEVAQ